MRGFKDANIYIEGLGIKKASVLFVDGKIKIVDEYYDGMEALDDRLIISPGFIDEHTHGANGSDCMDGTFEAFDNISKSILKEGTTSFLLTTMTMKESKIIETLYCLAKYIPMKHLNNAAPLGIHLEGPFISKKFKGAQNEEDVLDLNAEKLLSFITASNNLIREMTYSYKDGNDDFIRMSKEHGIALSLGHTDDTCEEAKRAFDRGTRIVTHMYNAMKGIHHRDVGTAGMALLDDRVSCELIADLKHVLPDAIRLLYKCKGKDKITLITDSMEAKYLEEGQYELGGNAVYVKDGTARLIDGTLAGSILKMNDAVRNIKNVLGIPLEQAIDMATINPAKNIGFTDTKGSIKDGKDADVIVIDKDVNVYMSIVNGNLVYRR